MGKAYANRKKKEDRPKGDLYHTPFSLVWKLNEVENFNSVWEPANGWGAISENLPSWTETVEKISDIETGTDFLECTNIWEGDIITNPPFDLWDDFVLKAKELAEGRVCMLGRLNYLGTYKRAGKGIWKHLHRVYVFNRYVDYQTPYRTDGNFHLGALCTGWFIWDKTWNEDYFETRQLDVQEYATLGGFK